MSADARRGAFIVLAGVVLSDAASLTGAIGHLLAARFAPEGSIVLLQGASGVLAWALGAGALGYAVLRAGERARGPANAGLLVVAIVVGLLHYPIASGAHVLASMALMQRGDGIEHTARVLETNAYVAAGLGLLQVLTQLGLVGWAWARWSAAARAIDPVSQDE
ncbi:MAG: hypothetical protein IT378_25775 [Sandaracinaceae bacterium]|nr:hypothetical protein [Sandaracinaceae bacterium]